MWNITDIETIKCPSDRFGNDSMLSLSTYWCPNADSIILKGTQATAAKTFFFAKVVPCE